MFSIENCFCSVKISSIKFIIPCRCDPGTFKSICHFIFCFPLFFIRRIGQVPFSIDFKAILTLQCGINPRRTNCIIIFPVKNIVRYIHSRTTAAVFFTVLFTGSYQHTVFSQCLVPEHMGISPVSACKVFFIRAKHKFFIFLPRNHIPAHSTKNCLLIFSFFSAISFAKACIVKIILILTFTHASGGCMPVLFLGCSILQHDPEIIIMHKILCFHCINTVFI